MRENNTSFLTTVLCLSISIIYRIIYILVYPVQPRDTYDYESFIIQWERFDIIQMNSSFPLFGVYLLKIPHHFFSYDIIKGGVIINMIFGLMTIYVVIIFAHEIFRSNTAALIAGIIAATNTSLIRYSCQMLRENTYIFFYIVTIFFLVRYYNRKDLFDVIMISLGIVSTTLCRKEGLELILITLSTITFLLLCRKIRISQGLFHFVATLFLLVLFFLAINTICGIPLKYYNSFLILK